MHLELFEFIITCLFRNEQLYNGLAFQTRFSDENHENLLAEIYNFIDSFHASVCTDLLSDYQIVLNRKLFLPGSDDSKIISQRDLLFTC